MLGNLLLPVARVRSHSRLGGPSPCESCRTVGEVCAVLAQVLIENCRPIFLRAEQHDILDAACCSTACYKRSPTQSLLANTYLTPDREADLAPSVDGAPPRFRQTLCGQVMQTESYELAAVSKVARMPRGLSAELEDPLRATDLVSATVIHSKPAGRRRKRRIHRPSQRAMLLCRQCARVTVRSINYNALRHCGTWLCDRRRFV